MLNLAAAFEAASDADEYLNFDRVANKLHPCPDVCAFLLLHRLAPGSGARKLVSGADHDVIYLGTNLDELAQTASQEDITTLVRCGVRYSSDGLEMFV